MEKWIMESLYKLMDEVNWFDKTNEKNKSNNKTFKLNINDEDVKIMFEREVKNAKR